MYEFIIGNVTGITSPSQIAKKLKVSHNTVSAYIDYYRNAFAVYPISKYGIKLYSVFETTQKLYLTDNSMFTLSSKPIKFSQKLENQIFLTLKRKYPNATILFGRDYNDHEIDFLIHNENNEYLKIQVTDILHENNIKREIGNLLLQINI